MTDTIATLRALEAAATNGPWEVGHAGDWRGTSEFFIRRPGDDVAICSDVLDPDGDNPPSKSNAALIAAIRNAAPALLACAEALEQIAAKASRGSLYHSEAPDACSSIGGIARSALAALDGAKGEGGDNG